MQAFDENQRERNLEVCAIAVADIYMRATREGKDLKPGQIRRIAYSHCLIPWMVADSWRYYKKIHGIQIPTT